MLVWSGHGEALDYYHIIMYCSNTVFFSFTTQGVARETQDSSVRTGSRSVELSR